MAEFFKDVQERLAARSGVSLRSARPDLFELIAEDKLKATIEAPDSSQLLTSSSNLCFVLMPFGGRFDAIYDDIILPTARPFGLKLLRADNIAAPGAILEQIRGAIQQSRICIAD